jgi:hypothetical protein
MRVLHIGKFDLLDVEMGALIQCDTLEELRALGSLIYCDVVVREARAQLSTQPTSTQPTSAPAASPPPAARPAGSNFDRALAYLRDHPVAIASPALRDAVGVPKGSWCDVVERLSSSPQVATSGPPRTFRWRA